MTKSKRLSPTTTEKQEPTHSYNTRYRNSPQRLAVFRKYDFPCSPFVTQASKNNNNRLEIKISNEEGAGKGLFTNADIEKGEKVIEYEGVLCRDSCHKSHRYCFEISPRFCLNATSIQRSNAARYVNDLSFRGSVGTKKALRRKLNDHKNRNNLTWEHKQKRVWMIATKFIPKGSELGISYGIGYWEEYGGIN